MPRKPAAKAAESPVRRRKKRSGTGQPTPPVEVQEEAPVASGYEPDGFVDEAPYWNKRLPWLAETPLCGGLHDAFKDSKTEVVYCKVCGFSFGLV